MSGSSWKEIAKSLTRQRRYGKLVDRSGSSWKEIAKSLTGHVRDDMATGTNTIQQSTEMLSPTYEVPFLAPAELDRDPRSP